MIQTEKLKILNTWRENNLFSEYSISEIMSFSNKKTKTWVFNSLKILTERKILLLKKKSNLNLYRLNFRNPLTVQFLIFLDAQENIDFQYLNIVEEVIDKIPLKTYTMLVFGSYAEGKQRKDSDLDICLLADNLENKKRMLPYINEVKLNYSINIDEHYILFDEFVKMLVTNGENLGKQIYKKHRLFFNAEIYYNLLKEGFKNGFKG